ncbi:MAG TPA: hypothetical protein VLG44_04525 [Chlamydiales bacterium]|nr:hypothetical protein [Chlamydiales bacterium]
MTAITSSPPPSPRSLADGGIRCNITLGAMVTPAYLACGHVFSRQGLIDHCTGQISGLFRINRLLFHPTCPTCKRDIIPLNPPKDSSPESLASKIKAHWGSDYENKLHEEDEDEIRKLTDANGENEEAVCRGAATLISTPSLLKSMKKNRAEILKIGSDHNNIYRDLIKLKIGKTLENYGISINANILISDIEFHGEPLHKAIITAQVGEYVFQLSLNKDNHLDLLHFQPATWHDYIRYLNAFDGAITKEIQKKALPYLKVGASLAAAYYLNLSTGLTALLGTYAEESILRTTIKTAAVYGFARWIQSVHPFADFACFCVVQVGSLMWDSTSDFLRNNNFRAEDFVAEEEGAADFAALEDLHQD